MCRIWRRARERPLIRLELLVNSHYVSPFPISRFDNFFLKGYEEDARVPDWYRWQTKSSHPGIPKSKYTNRAKISNSLLFRKVTGAEKGWWIDDEWKGLVLKTHFKHFLSSIIWSIVIRSMGALLSKKRGRRMETESRGMVNRNKRNLEMFER